MTMNEKGSAAGAGRDKPSRTKAAGAIKACRDTDIDPPQKPRARSARVRARPPSTAGGHASSPLRPDGFADCKKAFVKHTSGQDGERGNGHYVEISLPRGADALPALVVALFEQVLDHRSLFQ